jgi:hypothetical protein
MDLDPDPAIFVIDLQDACKKLGTVFSAYYFYLMIEGSGSVPLTNGSGSRSPKNMRILMKIFLK